MGKQQIKNFIRLIKKIAGKTNFLRSFMIKLKEGGKKNEENIL